MSFFNFFRRNSNATQSPLFIQEAIQLPHDFSQRVLELEMQIQFTESCDMEAIQELNELYRMAVEYYSNEEPKKANHFKKKLTRLLTSPITIDIIDKKPSLDLTNSPPQKALQQTLSSELHKFRSEESLIVQRMIEGNRKKQENCRRLINQNIKSQESRFMKRLEEKSRSKSKKHPIN